MKSGRILFALLIAFLPIAHTDEARANDSATAAYDQGFAHIDADRYEEALESFNEAIRLDPAFAPAYLIRGVLRQALEGSEAAIDDFNEVVRLDPENAEALNQRGFAMIQLDRTGEAIPEFTRALQIDPNLEDAYLNRGRAYVIQERWYEAIQDLNIAIDFDPENYDAYYYRGQAKLGSTDFEGMVTDMGEADRINSDDPRALQYRATNTAIYAGFGVSSYSNAIGDYETLLERNPDNEKALGGLGTLYGVMCRFDEAIPLLKRAIELARKSGRRTPMYDYSLEKTQARDESYCIEKP